MAPRDLQSRYRPQLRQQPPRPLGGSLSIALTRFLETVAARRRLLADHMSQPSQDAEHPAGS